MDPFLDQEDEEFEQDLEEVSSSYQIVAGDYSAYLSGLVSDVSSSGNKMWVWTFVVDSGQYSGREFKVWTALTKAALWKLAEVTSALGLGEAGNKAKFKRSEAVGRSAIITVVDSEYNGRAQSNISSVSAHPSGHNHARDNGLVLPF